MTGIKRPLVQDLPYSSTPCSIADPIEAGGVHLRAVVSPSWSSQQDNYDAGFAFAIRANVGAPCDLTGIEASTSHGRRLLVVNAGSASLTIKNESGSSTAVNRFALSADLVLAAGNSAELWYDETSTRWRAISAPSTGGGGGSSDHGALTGLGDDDHTQYHNDTRGDARYSLLGHTHGGGYTPKSFIDHGYSAGVPALLEISNSNKTGKNIGSANSVQIVSHQFFGGDGGKYYFQVVADADLGNLGIGLVTRALLLSSVNHVAGSYVGSLVGTWAYWAHGYKYTANAGVGGYSTYTNTDVIGVCVNSATGQLWFLRNDVPIEGDPVAGTGASYTDDRLKGQLHIHVTPYATNSQATIRGLSSEFTGAGAPSGYSAAFD